MIVTHVSRDEFKRYFANSMYRDNYSSEGLDAIYDSLEAKNGNTFIDIPCIAQDFNEYESLEKVQEDYPDIESLDDLEEQTTTLVCSNGHLIIGEF